MLTREQFTQLKKHEGTRIRLTFDDGQQVIANLFNISTDMDESRHVLYDHVEWSSGPEGLQPNHCFYVDGNTIVRFEGM